MSESLGALIGLSNVATLTRRRVSPGEDLDANASLAEKLRTKARRALDGREAYVEDAILAGAWSISRLLF